MLKENSAFYVIENSWLYPHSKKFSDENFGYAIEVGTIDTDIFSILVDATGVRIEVGLLNTEDKIYKADFLLNEKSAAALVALIEKIGVNVRNLPAIIESTGAVLIP
jgi:hypothetical protein